MNTVVEPAENVEGHRTDDTRARRLGGWVLPLALGVIWAVLFGVGTDDGNLVAGVVIATMLALVAMKLPIAVAMIVPAIGGLSLLSGPRAAIGVLSDMPFSVTASWSLSVVPMFVLMGLLLAHSGIAANLYQVARQWLGWLPGGLAVGTNIAGAGLASMSGSTVGTTYALTRIGAPEMLRSGYKPGLVSVSLLMSGLAGQLIPPSVFLVIYAGVASVPVGEQLIAGVLPGVLIAVLCTITLVVLAARGPLKVTRREIVADTWRSRFASLGKAWGLPVILAVVVGGILTGVFTATEAGAAGAMIAIVVALASDPKQIGATMVKAARGTVTAVGAIFFLIIAAHTLTRLISVTGVTDGLTSWITSAGIGYLGFIALVVALYLVLGMFMDSLTVVLITVPILLPALQELEISLLWFGVFAVFMCELAAITPPVGILTFITHSILAKPEVNLGQNISLGVMFRSLVYALPPVVVFLVLLIAFPDIALWMPSHMGE